MFSCEADIVMDAPTRCLMRLCKHWGHKFQVSYNERQGQIDFSPSSCELLVIDNGLRVRIHATDQYELEELQVIVVDHLQRMAGEAFQVDWVS